MIEPITYQINIALIDKDKNENFFYQKFDDYAGGKVREVIRTINGFTPERAFRINNPEITIDVLNEWTTIAKKASELTGNSINWELLKILNGWVRENL